MVLTLLDANGKPLEPERPEVDESAVSNMRKRIARAEMEEEYGSIGRDE